MLQAQFEMQLHGLLQVKQQFFRKKEKQSSRKTKTAKFSFLTFIFFSIQVDLVVMSSLYGEKCISSSVRC